MGASIVDWGLVSPVELIVFFVFVLGIFIFPNILKVFLPFFRFFKNLFVKPIKIKVPNWGEAPKWAKYLAQDGDGIWRWHDRKPKLDSGKWYSTVSDTINFAGYTKLLGDEYKNSLMSKPKAKE